MAEKVEVSREVADAFQELLDKHEGNSLAVVYEWSEQLLPHKTDSILKTIDWNTLLALITDNHEIKLTPEEHILEKFNRMKNVEWDMYTDGMMFVLDLLDIKIKGINE